MEDAGFLKDKFLYRGHFLPTDFTTGIDLNRVALPRVLDSASHSNPQPCPPSLPNPVDPLPSEVLRKITKSCHTQSLLSELTPEKNNLHVLPSLRT
jgi:hypothetical protein